MEVGAEVEDGPEMELLTVGPTSVVVVGAGSVELVHETAATLVMTERTTTRARDTPRSYVDVLRPDNDSAPASCRGAATHREEKR